MTPLARARTSLLGVSVGDAFGQMVDGFGGELPRRAAKRLVSMKQPWRWSDDTAMAISVVDELAAHGTIDPDRLAVKFAARFASEPDRGYGAGAYAVLARIAAGAAWRDEAARLFRGKGSYGNGAAMRAAPIGAYFAADLERVRDEALRSAAPTHAHPDGAAGAVAVAVAAAVAHAGGDLLAEAARWTPASPTRDRIERARELGLDFDVQLAGEELGTGSNISSRDTVPFALWVAARHPR
ncbi:MAG TPA: ADP-ribosylglycohydrolase family protein, partial [Kofleriaceae bacterium]|nr:ADP-ribosylglycohydrolase family protein [Kofleriaceae bacterium]